jgi:predicted nucleic acid-binding protein
MGLMIDTNVFIRFERSGKAVDLSILTDNVDEFSRVPDLRVLPFVP